MTDWSIQLAKEFKKRDKAIQKNWVVGEILNLSPLQISVYNGAILLEKEDIWMTYGLQTYFEADTIKPGAAVLLMQEKNRFVALDLLVKGGD